MDTLLFDILETSISVFENVAGTEAQVATIGEVLYDFKSERYARTVRRARALLGKGDEEGYKMAKAKLPVVTFSGRFEGGHKRSDLREYSNVVVLDIDDLEVGNKKRVKEQLSTDSYVFAYWTSPSKRGFKALVYLVFDYDSDDLDARHKNAFGRLTRHFSDHYGITLDSSGSDYSRLCFACWDKGLVIKEKVFPFHVKAPERRRQVAKLRGRGGVRAKPAGTRGGKRRGGGSNQVQMEAIIRYLEQHGRSITRSYNDWLEVAFAIVSTFEPGLGREYFLQLSRMDVDKFDEGACIRKLDECYRNSRGGYTFATIVYKARQQGYVGEREV